MKRKYKILLLGVGGAIVVAVGAFAWTSNRPSSSKAAPTTQAAARPMELIREELHTIKPRGLVDVVRFTGTTQPVDQTIVKARVAGRLAEVLVREGDKVSEGQLLARFET